MRGMAAIAILIYHAEKYLGMQLLPNAYLAVDLFFLLSGFVIAHNYDGKFTGGMSLTNFMVQRLIRLYPCFLLAFAPRLHSDGRAHHARHGRPFRRLAPVRHGRPERVLRPVLYRPSLLLRADLSV